MVGKNSKEVISTVIPEHILKYIRVKAKRDIIKYYYYMIQ